MGASCILIKYKVVSVKYINNEFHKFESFNKSIVVISYVEKKTFKKQVKSVSYATSAGCRHVTVL